MTCRACQTPNAACLCPDIVAQGIHPITSIRQLIADCKRERAFQELSA